MYDGVKDAESYGKYLICKSGHFDYNSNLDKYIDFKRYGENKLAEEKSAFTSRGCIIYHEYNQKLANLLFENLGMAIPKGKELKTLKLYMPLMVNNYDAEYEEEYEMDTPTELPD